MLPNPNNIEIAATPNHPAIGRTGVPAAWIMDRLGGTYPPETITQKQVQQLWQSLAKATLR